MKNSNKLKFSSIKALNAYLISKNNGLDYEVNPVKLTSIKEANHTVKSLLKQVNSGLINLAKQGRDINPNSVLNLVYFPAMYTLSSDEAIDNYLQNPNMFMGNKIYNFDYKPVFNV
jgi:hypothetical protein